MTYHTLSHTLPYYLPMPQPILMPYPTHALPYGALALTHAQVWLGIW